MCKMPAVAWKERWRQACTGATLSKLLAHDHDLSSVVGQRREKAKELRHLERVMRKPGFEMK